MVHRPGVSLLADFCAQNGRGIYMKALYQQMWDAAAVDGAGITRQEVSAIAEKNMFFYHAVLKNFLKKTLTE